MSAILLCKPHRHKLFVQRLTMNDNQVSAHNAVALHVFQQAIETLGSWVNANLQHKATLGAEEAAIVEQSRQYLQQTNEAQSTSIESLQLVFDSVALTQSTKETPTTAQYWPIQAIGNQDPITPYPVVESNGSGINKLKNELKQALEALSDADWQSLSLLVLIVEKYGSYVSYGDRDIAFFDLIKMTAAVATALSHNPSAEELCLIAGDLSGIQSFIYTIASDGALKSLRARSFLLELVAEEVVQQLLEKLALPRTSVIYAGGGNLYLLAPQTDTVANEVEQIRTAFNDWLVKEYQGKVFLGLASHPFPTQDVATSGLAKHWEGAIKQLSIQKGQKFRNQLECLVIQQDAHEPCKVCHRDDVEELRPLGGDGAEACPTCNEMFDLGSQLFKVKAIVRSRQPKAIGELTQPLAIKLADETVYFHLFEKAETIPKEPQSVYLINNWTVDLYKFPHFKTPTPLLLGNYAAESEEEGGFITAAEMAKSSQGIQRVGHLRMDVDRLGQIFARGLGDRYTLPRLSSLSRQLSYFFKVYLNSLAENRHTNLPTTAEKLSNQDRKNLMFIYAGGDDLFVNGAWNEVVEFAFDVYQSFRAYTGNHRDITLSGGISLSGPKYPLYQSAADSGKFESEAKGNGRDSLSLFGQVFKWQEWIGEANVDVSGISLIPDEQKKYIGLQKPIALYGISPFVARLNSLSQLQLPRSFVQNLLNIAKLQEQQVKGSQDKAPDQAKAIRYFLHLPKVAYMLARLPNSTRAAPGFESVSSSLKSPYNAPYFRAIATWLNLLNRSDKTIIPSPSQNRESTQLIKTSEE